jgi:Peptidase family C25
MPDYENGINGSTGEYLFPSGTAQQIADQAKEAFAQINRFTDPHLSDLRNRSGLRNQIKGTTAGVDPTDLTKAGWGVIFAQDYSPYSLDALKSIDGLGLLLKHRQEKVPSKYYRECEYRSGWDKTKFLSNHNAPVSGAVDPNCGMPYYLLIVGDPTAIPYEFQYQLDVQYAVGRIYFDTLEEYAHYAQSVVRAETQQIERPRQIKFWGVSNSGDNATQLSAKHLVTPLSDWVNQNHPTWATSPLIGDTATKSNLHQILNQESAPAILFTASHGVGFPKDDPHQKDLQGALVSQEWQPFLGKLDPETHLFSADDLTTNADIHGMVAFQFACYSLGTPQFNNFKNRGGEPELADRPLVARLPQKLLSHEKGGALAVIGHVDRAFSDSFRSKNINQSAVFQSILTCLMKGCPVGYAMEFFNQQYAELATDTLEGIQNDLKPIKIADFWNVSNNARNYAVFGDPAVKISVAQPLSDEKIDSVPLVWFKPSDKTGNNSPENDRLTQLEKQVQTLQSEISSLKQDSEALKQRLTRLEDAD